MASGPQFHLSRTWRYWHRLDSFGGAMRRQMGTCVYISGPPCVGKSTVAMAVRSSIPEIETVHGDDYWIKCPGLPFWDRVAKVNQDILGALNASTSFNALCEWVPCRGPFVEQLLDTCRSLDRRFLHVILTAPMPVLRNRKRERDGDEDMGPEVASTPDERRTYECLVFDTTQVETSRIAGEVSEWIQSKGPQKKPRHRR